MSRIGKTGVGKWITDGKGGRFIGIGGMIQMYGVYHKAVLDGGFGCDGCSLGGRCGMLKGKFGSCMGVERPDGNDIIFVRLGVNPFR